jgi:hypothetical protein
MKPTIANYTSTKTKPRAWPALRSKYQNDDKTTQHQYPKKLVTYSHHPYHLIFLSHPIYSSIIPL